MMPGSWAGKMFILGVQHMLHVQGPRCWFRCAAGLSVSPRYVCRPGALLFTC